MGTLVPPRNELNNFNMDEQKGAEGTVDLAAEIARIEQEKALIAQELEVTKVREANYKDVALRRKGKLESDESFFGEHDVEDIEKTVAQREAEVRQKLETERIIKQKDEELRKANLKLEEFFRAKDMKPESGVGSSSGGGQEVKDGIFSPAQEEGMKARWKGRGFNDEQIARMLDTEKKNALARRSIS